MISLAIVITNCAANITMKSGSANWVVSVIAARIKMPAKAFAIKTTH